MKRTANVAVLTDGGLRSLVACMAAREAAVLSQPGAAETGFVYPRVLPFPPELFSDRPRMACISRQAERLTLTMLERPDLTHYAPTGSDAEAETCFLVAAAFAAARAGVSRLIWPESAGLGDQMDLDRLCEITDKAILVSRLVALDAVNHGQAAFTIETPYADVNDHRMADLALDLAAPVQLCWWQDASQAFAGDEAARWNAALHAVGGQVAGTPPAAPVINRTA